MKTLKTSRRFVGPLISLRALCLLEKRKLPFSLLDVITTDGVRNFNGQLSTGDVDCTWEMVVWQNGFWSAKGDFHEGGTVAGDFFSLELLLDTNHGVGAALEGSILEPISGRHLSLSKNGSDPWIRENWQRIQGGGITARLHATPAIGGFVAFILIALAVGGSVVFGRRSELTTWEATPCEEEQPSPGHACVHVRLIPPEK